MLRELTLTCIHASLVVAVPALTSQLIRFLLAKANHVKSITDNDTAARYIDEVSEAISTAVLHTSQTYCDELKRTDSFNVEHQRLAFQKALFHAKQLITVDAAEFINKAHGDITQYIESRIEAEIKRTK